MGRSGEVPFFFIRHARANVVNDNTPPHTSPRSLGVFEDRSCQRLGNPWRARSVHRGPEVFLWKALVAQRWQERDGRDKPTTSTKRSGQFPRNPNPHRSVIPKRGHVTQRSGASPSPKSNFAAFSGKGHEVIFEFHASPYRGVSPRRRISLALLQPTPVTRHGRQPGGANASVGGSSLAIGFVPTPRLDFGAKR